MLSAAFTRVAADRRVADGTEWTVSSFSIAQGALSSYMSSQDEPPANGDSVRVNVAGGFAWVVPWVIQDHPDPTVPVKYVIRSTAYMIDPAHGPDTLATRTVAQFARWQPADITRVATFTAANTSPGIDEEDGAGSADMWIYGADECGEAPAIDGVRSFSSGRLGPKNPDNQSRGLKIGGTPMEVALETKIDWDAIKNSDALEPNYTSLVNGDMEFKTYFIETSRQVSYNVKGTGLLVVTGELETRGSYFEWDGVVLLGKHLDTDATLTRISGLLVTGLNRLTGDDPGPGNQVDEDKSVIRYNSCHVRSAVERWEGFVRLPGGWVDTWNTY
jgi:hypothetical protein